MSDIQTQFVKNVLAGAEIERKAGGSAFAPSNIALSKYWGKRNAELNLPINSSLSVSLGRLGTQTELRLADESAVYLNGESVDPADSFATRTLEFLNLFPMVGKHFEVRTENNIPTAAGLASSASGFAALVMALDDLAGWGLDKQKLSMLARLGSGSASRSVFDGFVQWHAGTDDEGTDSFAERLDAEWPEFRIGILELSRVRKPVGSRDGMNRTVETSELYNSWPVQAHADIDVIRRAIEVRDFPMLGKTAERNALSMHATMMSAWPPLIYLQPESIGMIHKVQRLRADGLELYLTIDAGPNIKLLFLESAASDVRAAFPDLQVIQPFG
ncbi:diphosphomevalonate decarboxylase [Pontiella sp.]|uniref:diphosphomevalonate decarboxylase n=1 Tax=Pontiella sp. TaxID=2837462 RepID=UPI00356B302C